MATKEAIREGIEYELVRAMPNGTQSIYELRLDEQQLITNILKRLYSQGAVTKEVI